MKIDVSDTRFTMFYSYSKFHNSLKWMHEVTYQELINNCAWKKFVTSLHFGMKAALHRKKNLFPKYNWYVIFLETFPVYAIFIVAGWKVEL